jgi:hypothetical protein
MITFDVSTKGPFQNFKNPSIDIPEWILVRGEPTVNISYACDVLKQNTFLPHASLMILSFRLQAECFICCEVNIKLLEFIPRFL